MKQYCVERKQYKNIKELRTDLVFAKSILDGFLTAGTEIDFDEEITREQAVTAYNKERARYERWRGVNRLFNKLLKTTDRPSLHPNFALMINVMDALQKDSLCIEDITTAIQNIDVIFERLTNLNEEAVAE